MESAARIVLTYLRTIKFISRNDLNTTIQTINHELNTSFTLIQIIDSLNESLAPYHFKIEANMDESINEIGYSFINTDNSSTYSQFSAFKDYEIQIIKQIIDLIFEHEYHYNIDKLINYMIRLSGRSYKEVYFIVTKLINNGWLEREDNEILVSVRLKSELKSHLERFDLRYCKICSNMVTRGVSTGGESFHTSCFDIYRRTNEVGGVSDVGLPGSTESA